MTRKVPLEDRAGFGNLRLHFDGAGHQIELDDPIDELKVLGAHGLCRLRRDQTVYAGAEIVEDEVLLGRSLAVIDLLGPLLERQLDPESLVDGEGNIEEIQAVDPEIVNGVALRLDLVAGNIARLGGDGGGRV